MKSITIISILIFTILIACQRQQHPIKNTNEELVQFIKNEKKFIGITSDSLPQHIKPYQTSVIEFLKISTFNPVEYYVDTNIHTWTEYDKIYSDTSSTYLSLNLYHLNYFKLMLQDEKDFLNDSIITYRKGNVGGKNFNISINKENKNVSGPFYWK